MSDSLKQALAKKLPSLAMAVKDEILPKIKVIPEASSKITSSRQLSVNEKNLKAEQAKEKYIAAQAEADKAENKMKKEYRLHKAIRDVVNLTYSLAEAARVYEVDRTTLSR
jgi:endo-alpha-1,4-polygalactosaminidase (GH114 family)